MADKDKPSVLENKDEFEKDTDGAGADRGGENAKARDEMGHMAEKTKGPATGGGSPASGKT